MDGSTSILRDTIQLHNITRHHFNMNEEYYNKELDDIDCYILDCEEEDKRKADQEETTE